MEVAVRDGARARAVVGVDGALARRGDGRRGHRRQAYAGDAEQEAETVHLAQPPDFFSWHMISLSLYRVRSLQGRVSKGLRVEACI